MNLLHELFFVGVFTFKRHAKQYNTPCRLRQDFKASEPLRRRAQGLNGTQPLPGGSLLRRAPASRWLWVIQPLPRCFFNVFNGLSCG